MSILRDQPFPSITPILLEDGTLHPTWREFFYALWLRTGGHIDPGELDTGPILAVQEAHGLSLNAAGILSFDPSQLDHNLLMNYSANRHIDHTAINVLAGLGLAGGGPISANVTLSVQAGFGINVSEDGVALSINTLAGGVPADNDLVAVYSVEDNVHYYSPISGLLGNVDGTVITREAFSAITANRAIMQRTDRLVQHASAGDLSHAWSIIGISLEDAAESEEVKIVSLGELEHSGMTLGALFCGFDGELISTPLEMPIAQFTRRVGAALSATALWSERGDVLEADALDDGHYLLREDGGTFVLEDGSGVILLESAA
jgi:hypothetical protein